MRKLTSGVATYAPPFTDPYFVNASVLIQEDMSQIKQWTDPRVPSTLLSSEVKSNHYLLTDCTMQSENKLETYVLAHICTVTISVLRLYLGADVVATKMGLQLPLSC